MLHEQATPALDLVLVGAPAGRASGLRDLGVLERDEPARLRREQHLVTLQPGAVQVHGNIGRRGRRQRRQPGDVHDLVDGPAETGQRRQRPRGRQQAPVTRKSLRERAQGRQPGEQVAEAERAEHEEGGPRGAHRATSASNASQSARKRARP